MKEKIAQISLQIIFFITIFVIFISIFLNWFYVVYSSYLREYYKSLALQIAESGIEYYRWRLNHNPLDYQNFNSPYIADYYDRYGNLIGKFILKVIPPATGSTIVTVESTGKIEGVSSIEKTIQVKLGKPSLAKYAIIINDNVRFGSGTEVFGEIHSNGGIRFDGIAHNLVNSAVESYDDPDHSGPNEYGVHTHVNPIDPYPPTPPPNRPDIFKAGRRFPVPRVDFAGLTLDLSQIKNIAYFSGFYWGPSGSNGYEIILKNNGTFDLYKVTRLMSGCNNPAWSIDRKQLLVSNRTLPQSGAMFFEDNLWISGQINNNRITIGVAKFPDNPSTRPKIIINSSIKYTNYDGRDVLSLISQGDVLIGLYSENDLRIDGALISQNGFVGRLYYNSYCGSYYMRNSITSYGMISSNKRYGFSWVCGNTYCSGYRYRYLVYDQNLLYSPPPYFPLASDFYSIIEYKEIK